MIFCLSDVVILLNMFSLIQTKLLTHLGVLPPGITETSN